MIRNLERRGEYTNQYVLDSDEDEPDMFDEGDTFVGEAWPFEAGVCHEGRTFTGYFYATAELMRTASLTDRQRRCVELNLRNRTISEIATECQCSERTVQRELRMASKILAKHHEKRKDNLTDVYIQSMDENLERYGLPWLHAELIYPDEADAEQLRVRHQFADPLEDICAAGFHWAEVKGAQLLAENKRLLAKAKRHEAKVGYHFKD